VRHRKAAGKLDQIAGDRWGMALTHSCWAACPFCPHVWTWRDAPSRPTIIESNALLTLSIRLSRDSGPEDDLQLSRSAEANYLSCRCECFAYKHDYAIAGMFTNGPEATMVRQWMT
jgi:hypothetical protein